MPLSRRALLAAAAVSPFASIAAAQTRPGRKVGFAVAGLGGYATGQILPNIGKTKHCKVTALVTGDPETKGARLAREYGVPRENVVTYDRIGELAGREGVDVLYVITPTGLHMEHTLAGFDAGLHVMCEKPMAVDVGQCDRMIAAAEEAGKKLMIGYRVHYEPHNLRAIELAKSERYAPVRHFHGDITSHMRGGPTWRNDPELAGRGGPLMDLGIYMVNAARYITGEEPIVVRGHTYRPEGDPLFPPGIESRCSWTFEFPSGATASGTTGYDLAGQNKYRVTGPDRWFELDPATGYGGQRLFEQRRGGRGEADDIDEVNQFVAEMDHFAQCILEDRTPRTPGEEGRADVRVMRAVYESAESGSAVELAAS